MPEKRTIIDDIREAKSRGNSIFTCYVPLENVGSALFLDVKLALRNANILFTAVDQQTVERDAVPEGYRKPNITCYEKVVITF